MKAIGGGDLMSGSKRKIRMRRNILHEKKINEFDFASSTVGIIFSKLLVVHLIVVYSSCTIIDA